MQWSSHLSASGNFRFNRHTFYVLKQLKSVLSGDFEVTSDLIGQGEALWLARANRDWCQDENILGIGLASGIADQIPALKIYVSDKAGKLRGLIPSQIEVPNFGMVDLKLETASMARAQRYSNLERPVRPGSSISNTSQAPGTACIMVRKTVGSGRGERFLLSCEHVLYGSFEDPGGKDIVQPAKRDSYSRLPDETIAVQYARGGLSSRRINDIDAAIARLHQDIKMTNQPLGRDFPITGVSDHFDLDDKVIMIGRSSGATQGKVKDLDVDGALGYELSPGRTTRVRFRNLVRCNYENAGGDSGAPVIRASDNRLIGLHIAGDGQQGYFCRISKVFSQMHLALP